MQKIQCGDTVVVLTGKDKNRVGVVQFVGKQVAIVENVNCVTKHQKPNPNIGQEGGIIKKEKAIAISNLAIQNPRSQKADRVGFKFIKEGEHQRKVRYFKSDGEVI